MVKQFVKYCIVGVGNTAVGLGLIYAAMGLLGLAPLISNFVGFAGAFFVSFLLNRRWTFQSNAHLGRSLVAFAVICFIGYLLNFAAVYSAIHIAGVNPYPAQLIGVAVYAVFVFLGGRYGAFRE